MFYSNKFTKFNNIKHCFFSKKNGYSKGVYHSLNCGPGSKDKKENVKKNLDLVSEKFGIKRENLVLMHQTHSNKVIVINKKNKNKKIIADALVTKSEGLAISVLTADCVPIILYDEINNVIGCIHAGWKGLSQNILNNFFFIRNIYIYIKMTII